MTFDPTDLSPIYGFITNDELRLLYRLASAVPAGGVIVEIGSFQGKSTVCLGKGAKVNGAQVWAIDPHNDYMVDEFTHYGMENHAALLKNLVDFGVADTVRVVALTSADAYFSWDCTVDLIFMDGDHGTFAVHDDFERWKRFVKGGLIAFHDSTNPLWPGVRQVIDKAVATGDWQIAERVDSICVLKRAGA